MEGSSLVSSSFLFLRTPEGVVGGSPFVSSSVDGALSSFSSLRYREGVAGESPFALISSVDDDSYSFSSLRTPEGVAGGSSSTLFSADSSEAGGTTISIGAPMHGAFRQLGESPLTSSYSVDAAPYSFLLSVAQDGGGSYNELATFYDGGKSGGLGTAFGGVNYFHLPVTSLVSVPCHICPQKRLMY